MQRSIRTSGWPTFQNLAPETRMFQNWLTQTQHHANLLQIAFDALLAEWEVFLQHPNGLLASSQAIAASPLAGRQYRSVAEDLAFYRRDYRAEVARIGDRWAADIQTAHFNNTKRKFLDRLDGLAAKIRTIGIYAFNHPDPPVRSNNETEASMTSAQGGVYCSVFIVYENAAHVLGTEQRGIRSYAPPLTGTDRHAEKLWKDGGTERSSGPYVGREIAAQGDALVNRLAAIWAANNVVHRVEFNITKKPCDEHCSQLMTDYRTAYEGNLQGHLAVPWWLWTYADDDQQKHVYFVKANGIHDCGVW